MTIVIGILILAAFVLRELAFIHERGEWREERRQLLDRIMAANLAEYKQLKRMDEKPPEKKEPRKDVNFL